MSDLENFRRDEARDVIREAKIDDEVFMSKVEDPETWEYEITGADEPEPIIVEADQTDLGASDDRPLGPDNPVYRQGADPC